MAIRAKRRIIGDAGTPTQTFTQGLSRLVGSSGLTAYDSLVGYNPPGPDWLDRALLAVAGLCAIGGVALGLYALSGGLP